MHARKEGSGERSQATEFNGARVRYTRLILPYSPHTPAQILSEQGSQTEGNRPARECSQVTEVHGARSRRRPSPAAC